jgi:glycosyltransferase involved in cell wall biosynthesis
MKIVFDLRNVGLGNNGGSSTIVKSANALVELGHEVIIADTGKIMYTWSEVNAEHSIIKNNRMPDADFVIATGFKSADLTAQLPDSCGIKLHWIRGWEVWQGSESWIKKHVLAHPTIKLVNGIGLKDKLKTYGVDSHLVRPGYDFDKIYPIDGIRGSTDFVILGGLNKQGKHARTKRPNWILSITKKLKKKYGSKIKLCMYGMDPLPLTKMVDHYIKNPTISAKNEMYNTVDIWLSPSILEGLHMPPAEAMITGATCVGVDAPLSGTKDYLIHEETGIVTEDHELKFLAGVDKLVQDKELRKKYGKAARKRILEIGDRKENMKKFSKLLVKIKKGKI